MWLLPTFGLLMTSLMSPEDFNSFGWWKIFSRAEHRHLEQLQRALEQHRHPARAVDDAADHGRSTILPILIASLAGYAFAWLEFPGRDWLFVVVIALLVVPLQMALIPIFKLYNTWACSTRCSA